MDVTVTQVGPGVHHARAKHVSWVLVTEGSAVTVVDTGYPGDRQRLFRSLERIGRTATDIAGVVLTHGHPDHIGSAEHLRTAHHIPVWTHRDEAPNACGEQIEQVSEATMLRMAWRPDVIQWLFDVLRLRATRVERTGALELFTDGPLDLPGRPVVVPTPGHTSGHCSVHLPERGVLLTGDALVTGHALAPVAGPQLLPDFFHLDATRARASLEQLRILAADVVVPGHGPVFVGAPARAVELALAG